jgi:hypothetical protein
MNRRNLTGLIALFFAACVCQPVAGSDPNEKLIIAQQQTDGTYRVPKRKPNPQQEPQQQQPPLQAPASGTRQSPPQALSQGAQQHAQSTSAANITERVLTRRLGSEGFRQFTQQLETMSTQAATGRGAPMADRWFDNAAPRGAATTVAPSGTRFFESTPPPVTGEYRRSTVQDAQRTTDRYGGIPGGVVLEGSASGLGPIGTVRYDGRFNAFILDERAVYLIKIPPKTVAILCRAIAQDDKVGVSLGKTHIVYGAVPEDSDLALDLKIADHFLGDIVFAQNDWTVGYRFANNFKPQVNQGDRFNVAVFFNLNDFRFQIQQEEARVTGVSFDVRLLPLRASPSTAGAHVPDLEAISRGRVSQYESNAQHVAENISYYRRERIVDRIFSYGEVAAFIRTLKQEGFDIQELARAIQGT